MAARATILGAAGFVGRRLRARLEAAGREVYAPARGDPELFHRDLGLVFYCAGLTADYDRRPFDTVEAHASLLSELIRAGRFERLVYCSSTRLYDGNPKPWVDETEPLTFEVTDPRRVYDLSKALGENLTLSRTDGRGSVARLSNVFDAADGAPGFLSDWLIQARTQQALELESSPHVARDYIHLDDAVAALIAIGDSAEGLFNVASGELVTNAAIAEVFGAHGWSVRFHRDARPPAPPAVSVERLAALGVRARPVAEVVGRYLEELKA